MHRLWRQLFRLLDWPPTVALVAAPLHLARVLASERFANRLLAKLSYYYLRGLYTWPTRIRGYVNLHFARFWWRLERHVQRARPLPSQRPRQPAPMRPRVGCVGELAKLTGFPPPFFAAAHDAVELHLFDLQYRGAHASFLERTAASYTASPLGRRSVYSDLAYRDHLGRLAEAINSRQLDLLLIIFHGTLVSYLVDRVDTPCIFNLCTGSDILHHPKVSYQLHAQPESHFFVDNGRLYSTFTRSHLGDQPVLSAPLHYDLRGIDPRSARAWSLRRPLIFLHGRLYKLAARGFLAALFEIMRDDPELELVYMGADDGGAQALIEAVAARWRLDGRVRFAGEFGHLRLAEGRVEDPGWAQCRSYLQTARLAPNPWPFGGGSTRFEAYASGAPAVHLEMATAGAGGWRRDRSVVDVPQLRVESGTAGDVAEYQELCRRCLYDEQFATRLVEEQLRVVPRVSDAAAWWAQVREYYRRWRSDAG